MKNIEQKVTSPSPFEQTSIKSIINLIAHRYLPFWPIFVLTIIVSVVVGHFYIHYQTPIYQANATIVLKDQANEREDANVLQALGVSSKAKSVENEIEILKSRNLMESVVAKGNLYAQLYNKGTLRDVLIYPSPIEFVAIDPYSIISSGPISFEYVANKNYITLAGKVFPVGVPVKTPYGVFSFNVNKKFVASNQTDAVKQQYYLVLRDVRSAAKGIIGNLSVSPATKQSSLISLTMSDPIPQRAVDLLTTIIKEYNIEGIEDKNQIAANTLKFLNKRLSLVADELFDVEGEYQNYRSREGIVNLSTQGQTFLTNVQTSDKSIEEMQVQLDILKQVENYIIKKGPHPGTVPAGVNNQLFNSLLEKLYNLELDFERLRQTSGERSPAMLVLREQMNQVRSSLLENISNTKQNLLAELDLFKKQNQKNAGLLKKVPQKERDLLQINRKQTIKNDIYTFLLKKREETELSAASQVADSKVVNSADSNGAPVKPIPLNIYLIALTVGIFAGVIFVLIREQYNQSILFRADIERSTNTPILSEIMYDDSAETLVIKDGKRTIIAEQFRALRTSLNYIGVQGSKNTILFTSSISGEGKSFMGINLAVSLALTGKKVALLEFDLRKPKVSKMLDIKQEPGISNYLAGLVTIDEIKKPLTEKGIPGLIILPAGAIPHNPTELMLNGRLDILMESLKEEFDYVLIDSPPIGLVTDAKILNTYSDACLYMVRHRYTPKGYLKLIDQLYVNQELKNINLIFNGLKARGVGHGYGYGYGYGSGYGYGYGYGEGYGYVQDDTQNRTFIERLFKKKK